MAKSSRASSNKRNSQALRAKVFDPAAIARAERLSAKLQDLITQPKAKDPEVMDVEQADDVEKSASKPEDALVTEGMPKQYQLAMTIHQLMLFDHRHGGRRRQQTNQESREKD